MADSDGFVPNNLHRSGTRTSSAAWALAHSTSGERISTKTLRGLGKCNKDETPLDAAVTESTWLSTVQLALQYNFRNADLLEEALESMGNGVVCEGSSNRVCVDGKKGLARVGDGVIRFVAEDLCYLLKVHAKDVDPAIKSLLSTENLAKTGKSIGINKIIRPKAPLSDNQKKNPLAKVAGKVDKTKLIAEGVKAIVGAVYYDGGYLAAKGVIGELGLVIMSEK